jgi:hypothetical protein
MQSTTTTTATNPSYQEIETPRHHNRYHTFFRKALRFFCDATTILGLALTLVGIFLWIILVANGQLTRVQHHCGCLDSYGYSLCADQGVCCIEGGCNVTKSIQIYPLCLKDQVEKVETDEFKRVIQMMLVAGLAGFVSTAFMGGQLKKLGALCMILLLLFLMVNTIIKWVNK